MTLKEGFKESKELIAELKDEVRRHVGGFARPDVIHITANLPKTRSGKIMRRILRAVANDNPDKLGDVSTLAEPHVVKDIVDRHPVVKKAQIKS